MTKKSYYLAIAATVLAGCSNDFEGVSNGSEGTSENAIGFEVINRNSIKNSRAEGSQALNAAGHYNFGVWAYKNVNETTKQEVMLNYLVGYQDKDNTKGYSFGTAQSTLTESHWAYENLGTTEYTYNGEGYYKASDTNYMSNWEKQSLKYWDMSSASVDFYAYSPYINGTNKATFDPDTKMLTLPDAALQDGYDDATQYDYLYAYKHVAKANYNNKVQLAFKRISAQIRIGFYENIKGYKVEILNLREDENSGVCAAPAVKNGDTYTYGTMYKKAGATINYTGTPDKDPQLAIATANATTFTAGTDYLKFAIPSGQISESSSEPTMSATKYYVIPANSVNQTGLTFHVTYKLISEDSNETIIVRDATVYVPYQDATTSITYCAWQPNYIYNYIFRITKNSTGTTDSTTIDPSSPTATTDTALKPIIFEGCTVENWDTPTSEHAIN